MNETRPKCSDCGYLLDEVRVDRGEVVRYLCATPSCPAHAVRILTVSRESRSEVDLLRDQLAIARAELERQRDVNWNVAARRALERIDALRSL